MFQRLPCCCAVVQEGRLWAPHRSSCLPRWHLRGLWRLEARCAQLKMPLLWRSLPLLLRRSCHPMTIPQSPSCSPPFSQVSFVPHNSGALVDTQALMPLFVRQSECGSMSPSSLTRCACNRVFSISLNSLSHSRRKNIGLGVLLGTEHLIHQASN